MSGQLNVCQVIGGYPVEPLDVPTHIRHLKAIQAITTLTESPLFGYSLGRRRILDVIEMTRTTRGIDTKTLMAEPSLFTIVNANSPLQYDVPMLKGVIELARRGQMVYFTPFTLAGAMAPVSLAGALTQQNADALADFVLAQVVRPGAPVIHSEFTSNVDMRTSAPAFGTPEYTQAVIAGGQSARRYGVPYRSSNTKASNAPDEQAVYETMMSLWPYFLALCNFLKHGLGWLEGGLTASLEKIVLDAELIQMMVAFLKPPDFSVDELGQEAMAEVSPGGHFSAPPTPWLAISRRSIARCSLAGRIMRLGGKAAPKPPVSAPTGYIKRCSPIICHRRWTQPCWRNWTLSSPGGPPTAAPFGTLPKAQFTAG